MRITWDDNKNGYTHGLHVVRVQPPPQGEVTRKKRTWPTNGQFDVNTKEKNSFNEETLFVKPTQTARLRIFSRQKAWHNAGVRLHTPQEPCGRLPAFSSQAGRRTAPPGCQGRQIQRGNGNPASIASFRRTTTDKTAFRVQRTEAENQRHLTT